MGPRNKAGSRENCIRRTRNSGPSHPVEASAATNHRCIMHYGGNPYIWILPAQCGVQHLVCSQSPGIFSVFSGKALTDDVQLLSAAVFIIFSLLPLAALGIQESRSDDAPIASILKAFNLCFTSTIISIITVINFALAASMAVLLGLPLIVSTPSPSLPLKLIKYAAYACLGLGWLIFAREETMRSLWYWEVLRVWFAPFVCIVYVPLVIQCGIACLL